MKIKAFSALHLLRQIAKWGTVVVKPSLPPGAKTELHLPRDTFEKMTGLKCHEQLNTTNLNIETRDPALEVTLDGAKILHLLASKGPKGLAQEVQKFVSSDSKEKEKMTRFIGETHSMLTKALEEKGISGSGSAKGVANTNGKAMARNGAKWQ